MDIIEPGLFEIYGSIIKSHKNQLDSGVWFGRKVQLLVIITSTNHGLTAGLMRATRLGLLHLLLMVRL